MKMGVYGSPGENNVLLQLGLEPKSRTLPYLTLRTAAPFTLTVLHDIPVKVPFDWVMLDLL